MGVPNISRHRTDNIDAHVAVLVEQGVDPEYVTTPCTIGQHGDCLGKVMRMRTGAYERCRCPVCNHPKPRVLRPH